MKKCIIAALSLFSLTIITMLQATNPAIANRNGCVGFQGRDDGGDTGYLVINNCGVWVTVNVYFSDGGSDYLIMRPGGRTNWTINVFGTYMVCNAGPNSPTTSC